MIDSRGAMRRIIGVCVGAAIIVLVGCGEENNITNNYIPSSPEIDGYAMDGYDDRIKIIEPASGDSLVAGGHLLTVSFPSSLPVHRIDIERLNPSFLVGQALYYPDSLGRVTLGVNIFAGQNHIYPHLLLTGGDFVSGSKIVIHGL